MRGADDDQAGVGPLGERVQPVGRRGVRNRLDLGGLETVCAPDLLEQLDAVLSHVGLELVVDRTARVYVVGEDVDEHELGAGHAGQAARQCDGIGRARRLVDAHDDLAHDRPFSRSWTGRTVWPASGAAIRTRPRAAAVNYGPPSESRASSTAARSSSASAAGRSVRSGMCCAGGTSSAGRRPPPGGARLGCRHPRRRCPAGGRARAAPTAAPGTRRRRRRPAARRARRGTPLDRRRCGTSRRRSPRPRA